MCYLRPQNDLEEKLHEFLLICLNFEFFLKFH